MEARLTMTPARRQFDLAGWLTVERLAYGAVAVVALALRLVGLGRQPLGPAEAVQAMSALTAAAGQPYDAMGISPLLFSMQRAFFISIGADELLARGWPAVLGGLAALLFWTLRDRLGRGGALAAAVLWAVSPLAVFTARLGLGDSLVPSLALGLLASLNLYAAETRAARPDGTADAGRWLVAAAVVLGLLLASGADTYTVILIGGVAALWWRKELPGLWSSIQGARRDLIVGGLGAFILGATFFLLTPAGLGAAADLLGAWLKGLAPLVGEYSAWDILRRLLLSEPLLVGFGIGGWILALRTRDRFGRFAGAAAGITLLIALAPRSRHPTDLGLVVLALALLAGPAVAAAGRSLPTWRGQIDPWLLTALELILLATAAQCLPGALNAANTEDWRQLYTTVGAITFGLAGLLWLIYGAFGSWRTVSEALPVVLLIVGLSWGISQLAGLSFDRGPGRQSGVLIQTPDAGGLADLRSELRELAALKGRGAREAHIDLVLPLAQNRDLAPLLRWELRTFRNVRTFNAWPADPAPIVLTMADASAAPGETYGGMDLAVLQRWRPESLENAAQWVRWLVYREAPIQPERQQVVLWVDRAEPAAGR